MHWFPLGGPVYGPSGALNNAYYGALQAMVELASSSANKQKYQQHALELKANMLRHFYDHSTGIYHLDKSLPLSGICQDVKAHAITLDLLPHHADDLEHLTDPESELPRAFLGLGHWDVANVASPYATGYAVEALFFRDRGAEAVKLLERVWGPMANATSPNYSGGHWEAMKPDGTPYGHDTSLVHGWSTWPVSLMPRYLAGLQPIEPGWKFFNVAPVLAGLTAINCVLETVSGSVGVELEIDEMSGQGVLRILAPCGSHAQVTAPQGWIVQSPRVIEGTGEWQAFSMFEVSSDQAPTVKESALHAAATLDFSVKSGERQVRNLPNGIRSMFSRFFSIRT